MGGMELNKGKISPREAGNRLKEIAEEFLNDGSQHSLKGLKELVNRRRFIISSVDISGKAAGDPEVKTLLEEINELEKSLERLGRGLQSNIQDMLQTMQRSQTLFKRFRKKNIRKPLFIDKMS